jgi:indole-3-glycerol phosphate synthase
MILHEIIEYKKKELEETKAIESLEEIKGKIRDAPSPRNFYTIFNSTVRDDDEATKIVAEIKKTSPSKGLICPSFDPLRIGRIYAENGASAISVLTERQFFQGDLAFIKMLKHEIALPLLRKDFIFDEYQVYESLAAGADAFLLIARILEEDELRNLLSIGDELNLAALVEVHCKEDLDKALSAGAKLIGINNRDLDTFTVDLNTTFSLLPSIPKNFSVISESGIFSRDEIIKLQEKGVNVFLIGEALLREKDIGKKLKQLVGQT